MDCEVQYYDFSAHAGHSELVEFAKKCNPEKIILFHSANRTPLVESLKDTAEVLTPMKGEQFFIITNPYYDFNNDDKRTCRKKVIRPWQMK